MVIVVENVLRIIMKAGMYFVLFFERDYYFILFVISSVLFLGLIVYGFLMFVFGI